jgi:phage gpG-like protein
MRSKPSRLLPYGGPQVADSPREAQQVFTDLWNAIDTMVMNASRKISDAQVANVTRSFKLKGARADQPPWLITRNPTPLIRTGHLMNSNEGRVTPLTTGWKVDVFNRVPYAMKHNFGLEGMPLRPWMYWADEEIDLAEQILIEEPIPG